MNFHLNNNNETDKSRAVANFLNRVKQQKHLSASPNGRTLCLPTSNIEVFKLIHLIQAIPSSLGQWRWQPESFVSHASHSLKWPGTAYRQQCTLFWAIVPNIKKQSGCRLIGRTCNRSSASLPWRTVTVIERLKEWDLWRQQADGKFKTPDLVFSEGGWGRGSLSV